jgi:nitrate/nitrite transport system permease protein
MTSAVTPTTARPKRPFKIGKLVSNIAFPLIGFAAVVFIWSILAKLTQDSISKLPDPIQTFKDSIPYMQNFFSTKNGDEGIFFLTLYSLGRVAVGFTISTIIAVPLGFLIGTNKVAAKITSPLIQLGKPISPLAWLPVGLTIFAAFGEGSFIPYAAAVFVIVVTSIWSTLINTALGAQSIPNDYWNVARVLNLSRWMIIKDIMIPSTLPYIFTGMRLSLGTAWLVIVAAEMLTGGTGIGFFVWDVYNTGEISLVIFSLIIIGIVGLFLDQAIAQIEKIVVGRWKPNVGKS